MNANRQIKALIVDDEKAAREVLLTLLAQYCPDIKVVASCESVDEAIANIKVEMPDVVFLDINMPGKDGFTLVKEYPNGEFKTVFISAFDQYAVQAFKFAAHDYLLKPIDVESLVATVDKLNIPGPAQQQMKMIEQLLGNPETMPEKIVIPTLSGFEIAELSNIVRLESDNNNVSFHFKDGPAIIVSKTLKFYEDLIRNYGFYRVHQSHMINLKHVSKYIRGTSPYLIMSDGTNVPIARNNKTDFLTILMGNVMH